MVAWNENLVILTKVLGMIVLMYGSGRQCIVQHLGRYSGGRLGVKFPAKKLKCMFRRGIRWKSEPKKAWIIEGKNDMNGNWAQLQHFNTEFYAEASPVACIRRGAVWYQTWTAGTTSIVTDLGVYLASHDLRYDSRDLQSWLNFLNHDLKCF